jgi:two-component system KDP operon response regulator KdpE
VITDSTILLIEDEPQVRRVLRAALAAKGANVIDAQGGEEALNLLRERTVDLVLLDVNSPGMGGLETGRAIRNGWDVPIIVISVRDSDRDKVEALDAGADDFVSKPFSIDELMARIRAVLRRTGFATDTTPRHISTPDLEVDFDERRVIAHGAPVRLTPTEFDILRYLVAQATNRCRTGVFCRRSGGLSTAIRSNFCACSSINSARRSSPPAPSRHSLQPSPALVIVLCWRARGWRRKPSRRRNPPRRVHWSIRAVAQPG